MTQGERDETKGGGSTPEASAEELRITHDWARRRLELYDRMERAIRDEISYALRSAADIRSDVEKDADAYMRRLQADRLRLLEEISELRRTRNELEEAFNRRRTEQETELSVRLRIQEEELSRKAAALDAEHTIRREQMDEELANRRAIEIADIDKFRSEAANAVELMISRAQTRKNELEEEARALEERVGHIQGMIDNFLNSQIQSLRGSLSGILPPKQSGGASTEATLSSLVSGIQGTRSAPARASTSISADVAAAERAVAEARAIAERAAADRAAADAQAQAERAAARAAAEEAARHAAEDAARRDDFVTLLDFLAVDHGVFGGRAAEVVNRRAPAEEFLNRPRNQVRTLLEQRQLIGLIDEGIHRVADGVAGGLVAGNHQQQEVIAEVAVVQPDAVDGHVVDEFRHKVDPVLAQTLLAQLEAIVKDLQCSR